jgi:hypothetical protein
MRNAKQYNHLRYSSLKIPLLQYYILLPATVKVWETFLEVTVWKPFQLFRRIHDDISSITKAPSLQCWFQLKEQAVISWSQARRIWGMLQYCHIVLYSEILDQNRPVCWSIVMKEKPTVRSPFFGAFPSDRIPKVMKDVIVYFFIHNSNSCTLYQRIPGTFWSYYIFRLWITYKFTFALVNTEFLNEMRYTSVYTSSSSLGSCRTTLGRFRKISWNRSMKILEYREKFQVCLEISREYLSGSWQYWSNILAQPTACLFSSDSFLIYS